MGDIQSVPETNAGSAGINAKPAHSWDPSKSHMIDFSNKGDNYGKPPAGSLTEARAIKARERINRDILTLLSTIRGIGARDESGTICVSFGRLFQYYEPISDNVVGILLRARRWSLVEFPGEMLYQRRDDNVLIKLIVNEDTIPKTNQFDE